MSPLCVSDGDRAASLRTSTASAGHATDESSVYSWGQDSQSCEPGSDGARAASSERRRAAHRSRSRILLVYILIDHHLFVPNLLDTTYRNVSSNFHRFLVYIVNPLRQTLEHVGKVFRTALRRVGFQANFRRVFPKSANNDEPPTSTAGQADAVTGGART